MAGDTGRGRSPRLPDVAPEDVVRLVKRQAAKQKVRIKLTEEQANAILDQLSGVDPNQAAEISFYVGRRAAVRVAVPAYWYRGDTCCV